MNPRHVAKLLEKSNLTTQEKAAIRGTSASTTPPTSSYDPANDAEFEGFDGSYEANRGNVVKGGEGPLHAISQTPTGRLWLRCFSIRTLGGSQAGGIEQDALALLPVLRATRSDKVRETVYAALRSLGRWSAAELTPETHIEIAEALAAHSPSEVSA